MTTIKTLILSLTVAILSATTATAFDCKVCHSKNPKMVAMHKKLEGQNCFDCHKVGEKLMGKSQPKDVNSLLKRRVTDSECLPCHGKRE